MNLEFIATLGGFDFTYLYDDFDRDRLVTGIINTIVISIVCIIFSVIAGFALALIYTSGGRLSRFLVGGFVNVFRNTPPLIQIYLFFFGFGAVISGAFGNLLVVPATAWAIIAVSVYITAFNIEAFRAAIEAIPKGYHEGAHALALPRRCVIQKIIAPLAFRAAIPSLTNNLVELIKSTSYAYAIAVPEVLYASSQIWADSLNVVEMMITMFVVYMMLIGALVLVMHKVEFRMRLPGYGNQ